MKAQTAEAQKDQLLSALEKRGVAGCALFHYHAEDFMQRGVEFEWLLDLSGELSDDHYRPVADRMLGTAPAWLYRWIFNRKKPFWLSRVTRFIPFSSRLLLRASAPPGHRRLADLILVPFDREPLRYMLFVGLFERPSVTLADEIITFGSAYLSKHVGESGELIDDGKALSPRQVECLRWIATGKSLQETADRIGTSYANVRYHLDRAKEQTGLTSLHQLVAFAALRYRLLPRDPEPTDDGTSADEGPARIGPKADD
ncbi:MAG: helix-turn-helix domain-containing protein [Xanthomonadales bacterium]|nr:helix-turn-helix domain-containing protein [Xanthomonadales bacterium]